MSESIERLIHDWREAIPACAKAKAEAEYLREFRKSKKAILMAEAEAKGFKTGQERETYAYSHPDYIALLEGLKVAVENSESLKHRMNVAERRVDIWRTKSANVRREQGMYGN
jgi:hypothetical protein